MSLAVKNLSGLATLPSGRSMLPVAWMAGTLTVTRARCSVAERWPSNTCALFAAMARVVATKIWCVPAILSGATAVISGRIRSWEFGLAQPAMMAQKATRVTRRSETRYIGTGQN